MICKLLLRIVATSHALDKVVFLYIIGSQYLKANLFKTLVLLTFIYGTKIWGGNLRYSHWKGLGHEDAYDVSRQSVFLNYTSYCAKQTWRTSHRIIRSQAHYGFSIADCAPIPPLG